MQRLDDDTDKKGTLDSLISAIVTGQVTPDDEAFAQIMGLHMQVKQVVKSPETVRIMIHPEFSFDGVVDFTRTNDEASLLQEDWFDSTFVVANPGNAENWIRKALSHAEMGATIVLLLPAKTHTPWFHDLVLAKATQVRFIKGSFPVEGKTAQPQMLAVFKGVPRQSKRKSTVPLLKLSTSFTTPGSELTTLDSQDEYPMD